MAVVNSDYVRRLECENAELKCFNAKLEDMNKGLKQKAAQAESIIDDFMDNIYADVAEECGCVVLQNATCYQDFVGILIANGYSVEIVPIEGNTKLQIIMKEAAQ